MVTLKSAFYPPFRTVPAHITKAIHAVKIECSTIIIIVILGCIILILSGSLLWVLICKPCIYQKKSVKYTSSGVQTASIISEHNYHTIQPLSPYLKLHMEEEIGFIEDPYIPCDELETIYYNLEVDDSCTTIRKSYNCHGACSCPTYA